MREQILEQDWPALRMEFDRDGAVCLRQVFSAAWLDLLDRGVDRNIAEPGIHFADFTGENGRGRCIKDYWAWEHIPEYQEFFRGSPAAEIAGRIIDARAVYFLEDQFFQKDAGATTPTPWHQDQPYYEIAGRWCVVWIPLDPVSRSNTLEFVAGSHASGTLYTPMNLGGNATYHVDSGLSPLLPIPNIDADPTTYPVIGWELELGDCLVFHPRTIHGNKGNLSDRRSRRAQMRFAAEDAYFDQGVFPWASLVEGHGLQKGDLLRGPKFPRAWERPLEVGSIAI
jgi:ectoine hydroxylase-related dioxygenase (phytanoyl-CoA dioxygenase family)